MSDQCKVGSIVDIANALQRAGQIMRGDVQMDERKTMTIDELNEAKKQLGRDISALLEEFHAAAGSGVWVAGMDFEYIERIGSPGPILAAVKVDVRIR